MTIMASCASANEMNDFQLLGRRDSEIAPDNPHKDREIAYLRRDGGHTVEQLIADTLHRSPKTKQVQALGLFRLKGNPVRRGQCHGKPSQIYCSRRPK